jgi:endonuclease/exonuclease/phosphatase (EEP) superfamily protein YafD
MKTFFAWVIAALILLVVIATMMPLIEPKELWIRSLGFPRASLALLAAVIAVALVTFYWRSMAARVALAVVVVCLAYQVAKILPYTALAPEQSLPATRSAPQRSISLVIASLGARNRNIEALARQIRLVTPDIVIALEADDWWVSHVQFLEPLFPNVIREPLDNGYGMLVLSRRPLDDTAIELYAPDSIPAIRTTVELPSGERFDLYCVHPHPPLGRSDSSRAASELVRIGRELRSRARPAIVAGDFGDVPWSPTTARFQEVSGTLDPRVGRGLFNSVHTDNVFLRYPVDQVFHTPEFRFIDMRRLEPIGSSHFPIYVDLNFEPETLRGETPPEP